MVKNLFVEYRDAVNAREYGVDITGSDTTAAMNNAIAQVASNGGGGLFCPEGTYRFDTSIVPADDVHIFGVRGKTVFQQYGSTLFAGPDSWTYGGISNLTLDFQKSAGVTAFDVAFDLASHNNCKILDLRFENYTNCTLMQRFCKPTDTINMIDNEYGNWSIDTCVNVDIAAGLEGGATEALYYEHIGDGTTTVIATGIAWPEEFNSSVIVFLESATRQLTEMVLTTDYTVAYPGGDLQITLATAAATGTRVHIWPAQPVSTNRRPISNNAWYKVTTKKITGSGHQTRRWVDAETYDFERFIVGANGARAYKFNPGLTRSGQAGDYAVIRDSIIGKHGDVTDVTTAAMIDAGPGTTSLCGYGIRGDGTWVSGGTNYALTYRDGQNTVLTGTVATSGTTIVTGTGTAFQDELSLIGATPDDITISGVKYSIVSIDSDTQVTLSANAGTVAGVTAYRYNIQERTGLDISWGSRGEANSITNSRQGGRTVVNTREDTLDVPTTFTKPVTFDEGPVLPDYTSGNIADIDHALNTTDKAKGKVVWDVGNNRMMVASGSAAADPWYVADGSASVTPS